MRVVTWNLWWRFGPWEERRKAILAVLRDLRPDVVGLQEVWAARRGEPGGVARRTSSGMHWTWAASEAPERWQRRLGDSDGRTSATPCSAGGPSWTGRWSRLPSRTGRTTGGWRCIRAPGRAGRIRVPFFTTHLTSATHASAVRCRPGHRARRVRRRPPGRDPVPAGLTGDFNAWPDSDEIRLFGGYKTAPAVPGRCFLDAWEYAEPGRAVGHLGRGQPLRRRAFGRRPPRLHPRRTAGARRHRPRPLGTPGGRRPRRRRMAVRPRGGRRGPGGGAGRLTGTGLAGPVRCVSGVQRFSSILWEPGVCCVTFELNDY